MKKRILVALSAVLVAVMLMTTVSAASPFGDVKEGDWFYDAVMYVYDNALMSGTGDGNFAPTRILTRAEMAVMLYNLDKAVYGESEAADAAPFTDVDAEWAKPAINWAYANGVITGASATTFNPNGQLNRASMAVMFTRYIESKGLEDVVDISRVDENVGKYDMFNDEFDWENSDWYWDAVHYVGEVGLMGGKDSGNPDLPNFDPTGTASRAEAATVLSRLHKFLSIPSLGAERAFAQFQANYCCTVHADVLLHYNKQGNFNGSNPATRIPELIMYEDLLAAFDERMDYDRNEYFLRFANKTDVVAAFSSAGGTGASTDVVLELVRWDGQGSYTHTVETAMNQRSWTNDNVVNRQINIPLGNWACNDTEENYAAAIQEDLDAKFAAFLDYCVVDGKIHMNYEIKDGGYTWVEWPREYLNLAMANAGIAGCDYNMDIYELIDHDAFFEGGQYWDTYKDMKAELLAKLANNEECTFEGTLRLTLAAGMQDDSGNFANMPEATTKVTLVYHPVADRTTLLNGGYANIVVPTELNADEILADAGICEDCGQLHYIAARSKYKTSYLVSEMKDQAQVLFNKNKYTLVDVVPSAELEAQFASMAHLDIASGKATFKFVDSFSATKTLDVEIDMTIQLNANLKRSSDGRAWDQYTETIGVCPYSSDFTKYGWTAQEELDAFVEANTCVECGKIHINFNNAGEATVANVQNAILRSMGVRNIERVVYVTSDTKTFLNNNFNDVKLADGVADGKVYNKTVAIIYGSAAYADVAIAVVDVDARVNATYGTCILPTQTLTNEISGEQFITCPYNIANITEFEKSVINAKVDKIIADVGFDGTLYAWYGKGINGEGNFGYRHGGFGWAQGTAHNLVLRHADFTDCARIYDPNEAEYGTFTQASYDAAIPNKANDAVADGSILVDNKTFVLEFKTKTAGEIFQKEVKITIGRNDGCSLHPYGSYAFIKDPASAMAEEKAAIQAVFDSFIAANATDGVVKLRIDGDTMWWTWMEGVTGRLILDNLMNKYTDGALAPLVSAYVPDGYFVMGVMSQDDWAFLGKNMGAIPDGTVFEAREFTISIRGAKSGISQDYKIKLQITQDSSFNDCVEVVK